MSQDELGVAFGIAAITFAFIAIPWNLPLWKWLLVYLPLVLAFFILTILT